MKCIYHLNSINQSANQVRTRNQREPNIKTLRSPLSTEFFVALLVEWRNTTSGFCQSEEMIKH